MSRLGDTHGDPNKHDKHQGPVTRSLVGANHWLRRVETYTWLWLLMLVNRDVATILQNGAHTVSERGYLPDCHVGPPTLHFTFVSVGSY